jgi:hypothetical protein
MQEECSLQQYEDFFDFVKSVLQQCDTSEGQDKQKQVSFVVFVVLSFHLGTMLIGADLGGNGNYYIARPITRFFNQGVGNGYS